MGTSPGRWMLDAFTYAAAVVAWFGVILLHGLWRSTARPEPDGIRPSGPVDA